MKKNIILYGAGSFGIRVKKILESEGYNILFFIDSDKKKIGTMIDDKMIISISEFVGLHIEEPVIITVQPKYVGEIKMKLQEKHINNCQSFIEYKNSKIKGSKEQLAIWGWWQGNNLGDNWIRETNRILFPKATFIDTDYNEINDFGFVLIGGGGLFIDRIIPPWDGSINVPFGGWGLGVEFKHKTDKAVRLAEKADFYFNRDMGSYELMGLSRGERSYDVTFVRPLSWLYDKRSTDNVLFIWYENDLLTSSLYDIYTKNNRFYLDMLQLLYQKFENVEVNNFQTEEYDVEKIMSDCGFVVSGKFHGVVAAIQKGIPCIAIEMSRKIKDIMQDCGLGEYCIMKDEMEKVPYLIEMAKKNSDCIRKKQFMYCQRAHSKMKEHYNIIRERIGNYIQDV